MKKLLSICFFSFLFFQNIISQEGTIFLQNPSFEGIPVEGSINGKMPDGYLDCGFRGETIPDVHPKDNSAFGVTMKAYDGDTYIGLVIRDNETWEKFGQELVTPLRGGQHYVFSIFLARSPMYESSSKTTAKVINFSGPVKLRIWGGKKGCERKERLAESPLVEHTKWQEYQFLFHPSEDFDFIVFEAFYKTPSPFPYNGNLLLDNASEIVPVDSTKAKEIEDGLAMAEPQLLDRSSFDELDDQFTRHEFEQQHMGTNFKLVFYTDSSQVAGEIAEAAFARIAELDQALSDYREDSELSQLVSIAGTNKKMKVSDDLWNVLQLANEVTEKSKGSFDYTAGALTKLWRKSFRQKEMPADANIQKALETVGVKKVVLHKGQYVEIWQEGLRIDLGGIAKGYAVDEALKAMKEKGVTKALVDGGGDIAVGDPPPGKFGWKIKRTVYDRNGNLSTEPVTLLKNEAIATSGPTGKYLGNEGKKYYHIIDPRSGQPKTKDEIVSVVAPTCAEADAWATAMSVDVVMKAFNKLKKQGHQFYFSGNN